MAQYGCARATVNKAVSALAAAGLIERHRRAGSFVASLAFSRRSSKSRTSRRKRCAREDNTVFVC